MSVNPVISRDHVHALSEQCAQDIARFQVVAKRLLDAQPRLVRFFRDNMAQMPGQSGEVSLYLLAVILHIFNACGGKMTRIGERELYHATQRILKDARHILPGNTDFPARVRELDWRQQPHILDEALHALFEREERKSGEVDIPPEQGARMFLMLWAATEALNEAWTAPTPAPWAS